MSTWVVTGANRGIGLETCRQLKARGETVIAACRTSSPELDALGVKVAGGVEMTNADAAKKIEAALGQGDAKIDVLVLNAGVLVPGGLEALDFDAIRQQLEVNAVGPLRIAAGLVSRMGKGGKVAFISSRAGSIGDNGSGGMYGYRMSKAALNMAGMSLARDLAPKGIAVYNPAFDVTPAELIAGIVTERGVIAAVSVAMIRAVLEGSSDRDGPEAGD